MFLNPVSHQESFLVGIFFFKVYNVNSRYYTQFLVNVYKYIYSEIKE